MQQNLRWIQAWFVCHWLRQPFLKINSPFSLVFQRCCDFSQVLENLKSHGFQRGRHNCSYLFTKWLAIYFVLVYETFKLQCNAWFSIPPWTQQNHKKNYVIKCFLKQILGIKDVIEVMPLSKIDTVFFHSNQQLKCSSSF